ncbi:MAG: hypothetical protein N2561_09765 [Bacteroidetes bacterium]|nr:hypothetical protein [Bacteroidota bacterium]
MSLLFGTATVALLHLEHTLKRVRLELFAQTTQKAHALELIEQLEQDLRRLGRGVHHRSEMLLALDREGLVFRADLNEDGRPDSICYRWVRDSGSTGRLRRWVNGLLDGETAEGLERFELEPLDETGRLTQALEQVRLLRITLRYRLPWQPEAPPLVWRSTVAPPNLMP